MRPKPPPGYCVDRAEAGDQIVLSGGVVIGGAKAEDSCGGTLHSGGLSRRRTGLAIDVVVAAGDLMECTVRRRGRKAVKLLIDVAQSTAAKIFD